MEAITRLVLFTLVSLAVGHEVENSAQYPVVVSTWPFLQAVRAAWRAVNSGFSALDAVVEGCSACEELRCDGTVGPGGSPDENGETTLDAMVMNGATMEVGAVAAMRYVRDGIRAARLVMQHTEHTMLVGEQASTFAISMGLPGPANLSSAESMKKWNKWKQNHCQPNFRKNIQPTDSCGPYHRSHNVEKTCSMDDLVEHIGAKSSHVGIHNHDTISMAVFDKTGHIAVGTSTNGATFKIPGRVGDGPIAGSSAYADDEVGACGATGDGDIMMRFLPWYFTKTQYVDFGSRINHTPSPNLILDDKSILLVLKNATIRRSSGREEFRPIKVKTYQAVESMRLGMEPKQAARDAIQRIARKYPGFVGAVFAVDKNGVHAGACHGWTFQYSVRRPGMDDVEDQAIKATENSRLLLPEIKEI
ncbi:hypothetical protein RJ640_026155 [Escallonia rubra]|uniref:beta-aspartyl-peptidase n=1 Tax=Escallonia rubra TaxID=112253 RepID=A0AA88S9B9_9ASTE|nr:hypothetical protein RJ640_026155 [Escallonia rubra]